MQLKIGDSVPEICLKDQEGNLRDSKKIRSKFLILFFYPKDETPGCTAEACSFRDEYASFKQLSAEVWGVSADNERSHKRFAESNALNFPLLVDQGNKLRKSFGVPSGLGFFPGRVTYIIDRKGKIINIFNNFLNGPEHVKNALKALTQMGSSS